MRETNQDRKQAQDLQAEQDPPNRAEIARLVNEGAGLLKQGQAQQALSALREAWELDPTEIATAINLAGAYILLNRHKEAIPVLESAVSLDPQNAMILMNLGAAYLGNPILSTPEKQEKAIQAFERALDLQPGLANMNYNLGLVYRDRKQWEQARNHFQQALEVNPEDSHAKMLLEEMTARLAEDEE
jgi:tetratricopeptide (TPR) repeat protein